MDYSATLEYLFQKLPMFSKVGQSAFKKNLDNINRLCEALGNPQRKFKTIHVAGTNGKGSVSHMLSACLMKEGYRTGLYTSPHIFDFRERIRIDGISCSKDFVIAFTEKIKSLIETIHPSFFEITVAMAFEYFASQKVDWAVIEVGLGGRLDSTNIITPALSVITNIGWDHMNMLGDSLEKIAGEKAGIIKDNIPVVIGEYLPETRPVFEQTALQRKAPISFSQDNYKLLGYGWQQDHFKIETLCIMDHETQQYELDITGLYQTKNLLTVLEAIRTLNKYHTNLFNPNKVKEALLTVASSTGLHGRWEKLGNHPRTFVDVGHNIDGIREIIAHLKQIKYRKLHVVFGMVKDKEPKAELSLFPQSTQFYFCNAPIPRALDAKELQLKALESGQTGKAYPSIREATKEALEKANPEEDLVLICGSFFIVNEAVSIINQRADS